MEISPRNFTEDDVRDGHVSALKEELIDDPPDWMKRRPQETASGYGRRLNSGRKIVFNGRAYRLYVTICSNVGSVWFTAKGRKIYVSA